MIIETIPTNDANVRRKRVVSFFNQLQRESVKEARNIAKTLGVSEACAMDVWDLRHRSCHTPELEAELIRRHGIGEPPNINDFIKQG